MSTFKVGDVVQQIKEPRSVGVVVKIGKMWLVDRWEPDYVVAKLEATKSDNYLGCHLQAYAYRTHNEGIYTKHQTGNLVTFHRKSSSGYPYIETYYVGPKKDIRIIDGITFYPYINWEDHNVYYASYDWTGIQEIVKPKLQIGILVKIGSDKASPIVKIVYDRPYETHVYTLENGSNISGKNLNNYDWDRETNSWQHKDVKPVVEPVKEVTTEKQFKVGDVVQDRRIGCNNQVGVVTKAEHPRYTVNWVDKDIVDKIVYWDSLKPHPYKSAPNDTANRRPNSVLVVQTDTGEQFYQVGASEIKQIDGPWVYPYINLQTSELKYGRYYWKEPKEVLHPKFDIGDKVAWYAAYEPFPIVSIDFNVADREFLYQLKEGHKVAESALKLFVQTQDKVYRGTSYFKTPKTYKAAYDIGYGDSAVNLLEPQSDNGKTDSEDSILGKSYLLQKAKTVDNIEEKGSVLSSNPTLTVTVNGKEKVFEPAFKDLWREQWPAVAEYDNSYVESIVYANSYITKELLEPKKPARKTNACIKEKDCVYGTSYLKDCEKGSLAYDKEEDKLAATKEFASAFGESVANHYANAMRLQQLAQLKNAQVKVILAENSVKDTEPKGVKMTLSPVNARVIRLRSVRLLDSLSKKFFLERFPDDVSNFKIVGNLIDSKVPAALVLSLAGFSCKYGLPKAPTDIKPIVETLQKEFTEESQAMLTNSQLGVLKLIGDEVIASLISLVKEHVTDNDI